MLQLHALFKQPGRQEIKQKRCYLTKSNCIGHIKVQICLGDQNPLLPKSVPFCYCPAIWLHHPVSPQPPLLPSYPSRKKTPTWYNSGKTFPVSEISSEKGSRVVPSRQLQPLHCFLQLQRKAMTTAPQCCWDTGHTLLPHTLPQPPALAYSWKALVTWHSWEPRATGSLPWSQTAQARDRGLGRLLKPCTHQVGSASAGCRISAFRSCITNK